MGSYFSAFLDQINETSNSPSNSNQLIQNISQSESSNELLKNEVNSTNMDYNDSPSPSSASLSFVPSFKSPTGDNYVNNNKNNKNNQKSELENERNEFVNNGLLHYNKIRNRWLQKSQNENDKDNNESSDNNKWNMLIMDDEEIERIYQCISEKIAFDRSVPLEEMVSICNKMWKHEQLMGYEITDKQRRNQAMAFDRL